MWGPLVNGSKQCMWGQLVNSTCGPTVNSAVWAPRGGRTRAVAPILGPLVYVLNYVGHYARIFKDQFLVYKTMHP